MVLFSIVIPAYNSAAYIATSLNSVVSQSFRDFEVVVVDNGSSDETVKIARSILEPSRVAFKIVSLKKNKGIAGGRNSGIKASKGKYVSFLDSDDAWYPKKLERVKGAFEKNVDACLVCHDVDVLYGGKKWGATAAGLTGKTCTNTFYSTTTAFQLQPLQ